ncbi:MAG: hypothetical protein HY975_03300 [Candidatus Kerfeldbacteria bacterium]|nr:hypothetical protein [Candidatus Kerfeldbacteria bacterium]
MNPTLRRALEIAGFVLIVAAIGFAIYYVFFRPQAPIPGTNVGGGITNGLPTPANGNVNRTLPTQNINQLPVVNTGTRTPATVANGGSTLSPTMADNNVGSMTLNLNANSLQFYDRGSGQFYSLATDGSSKTLLTNDTYPNASAIVWAPNGNQALLSFPDNSKILYDFGTKKQTTLPKELSDFSWSPTSDYVASKFLDTTNSENQWLIVTRPDGSQSQTAEHLGANADRVRTAWSPNNQIIATYEKATNADQSEIIFLGANGENYPSVTVPGRGYVPNWSPDGRRVLYSIYNEVNQNNPHLYIMNGQPDTLGNTNIDLGLNTRADKCTFDASGQTVYCAVPYYLNPGSGPQPELSSGIPDNIYRIDLRSGTAALIARPVDAQGAQRFSAANLQLSPAGDVLFFTDATTGTVQKVQLR